MKHYLDIRDMRGGEVPPVDIITFGSPCQDLSIAGKRAGLDGDRSGLFMQAIRIIKEMREATHGEYPIYALWENVPGTFSSQRGEDFRTVLEEICRCKDSNAHIPEPPKRRGARRLDWRDAGEIVADGYSVAWRVIDTQFHGCPQRRRRIFLVADFAGHSAGEILFTCQGLPGYPDPSTAAREGATGNAQGGVGGSGDAGQNCLTPWDYQSKRIYAPNGVFPTVQAGENSGQNSQAVMYPAVNNGRGEEVYNESGRGYWMPGFGCLRAEGENRESRPGHIIAYAIQGNCVDRAEKAACNGAGWCEDQSYTLNTIDRHAVAFMAGQGANARSIAASEDVSPTLRSEAGGNSVPSVVYPNIFHTLTPQNARNVESAQQPNCVVYPTVARTLTAEADASPCIDRGQNFVVQAQAIDCRNLVVRDLSGTLQAKDGGGYSLNYINPIVYDTTQITCPSCHSNPQPGDPCHTLCVNQHPQLAVYDARGNGDGDISPTLTGDHENRIMDYTAVLCAAHGQPIDETTQIYPKVTGTLCANSHPGGCTGQDANNDMLVAIKRPQRRYIVRRLTPTECQRLQGFPDGWGDLPTLTDMTDEDYDFWTQVRKTHTKAYGKKYRHMTKAQTVRWYNKLHTDSAEYKMWGNGASIPTVRVPLHGMAQRGARTLGSLFDGSGAFPLAGLMDGIVPLWSSEIEPYPIAVTKEHFKEV